MVNRVATNSTADQLTFQFITRRGELIDSYSMDSTGRAVSSQPAHSPG